MGLDQESGIGWGYYEFSLELIALADSAEHQPDQSHCGTSTTRMRYRSTTISVIEKKCMVTFSVNSVYVPRST